MFDGFPDNIIINCGDTISNVTVPDTIIKSPNYPDDYPADQDCRTVITFTEEERVRLQFLAFDLESSSTCNYDWLEVRDGDDASANLTGSRLCGEQIPGSILSSGNSLYIEFNSDEYATESGFKVKVYIGKEQFKVLAF